MLTGLPLREGLEFCLAVGLDVLIVESDALKFARAVHLPESLEMVEPIIYNIWHCLNRASAGISCCPSCE